MYTVFEGAIESMALDETQNYLAIVGLGRVIVLRVMFEITQGQSKTIAFVRTMG